MTAKTEAIGSINRDSERSERIDRELLSDGYEILRAPETFLEAVEAGRAVDYWHQGDKVWRPIPDALHPKRLAEDIATGVIFRAAASIGESKS